MTACREVQARIGRDRDPSNATRRASAQASSFSVTSGRPGRHSAIARRPPKGRWLWATPTCTRRSPSSLSRSGTRGMPSIGRTTGSAMPSWSIHVSHRLRAVKTNGSSTVAHRAVSSSSERIGISASGGLVMR